MLSETMTVLLLHLVHRAYFLYLFTSRWNPLWFIPVQARTAVAPALLILHANKQLNYFYPKNDGIADLPDRSPTNEYEILTIQVKRVFPLFCRRPLSSISEENLSGFHMGGSQVHLSVFSGCSNMPMREVFQVLCNLIF